MEEGIYQITWDTSQPLYPDDFVWDDIKKISLDYLVLFKIPEGRWGGFGEAYVEKIDAGFSIVKFIGPKIGIEHLVEVDLTIINRSDVYHGKGVKISLDKVAELDQLDDKSFQFLKFYDIHLR